MSANANVTPFAQANAYGIAAVGLQNVISAGLDGDLVLVNDKTTVAGNANIKFDDDGAPHLDLSLTGENTYTLLAGRIYAYIKVNALAALETIFPGAVHAVDSAGKAVEQAVQSVGNALNDAGDAIASFCGWRRRGGVTVIANADAYGSDDNNALTYTQNFEIAAWQGWSGNKRRFMNYHINISPSGVILDGDSVDNTDREEAHILDNVMTLNQIEAELNNLEQSTAKKEHELFAAIDQDLNSADSRAIPQEQSNFHDALVALDTDRDQYLRRLISEAGL
jgi:hypothetical protein